MRKWIKTHRTSICVKLQAVNFLHESGVLLHYDETTLQMRDFYFINPGWLCRMMAQVVTVPEINPFISHDGVRTCCCCFWWWWWWW